jgi:hypothetical protein
LALTSTTNNTRQGAIDPLATARDLLRRGIMPLPVLPTNKNPIITGWQLLTITEANLTDYFDGHDHNVGGRMGHRSGGLTDDDLDCVEAITLAPYFLPTTQAIYGRTSKPTSHFLYRCDTVPNKGSIPFKDENKKMIVEIRVGGGDKGAQSIMPGSQHPSGEFVRWDSDGEPARIEFADLEDKTRRLAAAALLLRHWPETGRNDIALGVGGFLDRAGWTEEQISHAVFHICQNRGEPARASKHAATAASAVAARERGTETRGYPWLKETFNAAVAQALAKLVGYHTREVPPPVTIDGRPVIQLEPGHLSDIADRGEEALIAAAVPFYERANTLVRTITKEVDTFHGAKTTTAQFTAIDVTYMRDRLCRVADWYRLDRRANAWIPADVPHDIAATVLARAGEWHFQSVAGIITVPTLRPDGSVLDTPGYDPSTRLLLIDSLRMPPIPAHPTREDALAALKLITDLLVEFVFVDKVARTVAVSAVLTPIARGGFLVSPMHAFDAPTAGTGKSYLGDIVSTISTGKRMPVISQGASDEEMEKRVGAAVLAGQSLVCIDNVIRVLRGDALAQLIERPRPLVRILGRSELVEVDAVATTLFANGNNIIVGGDLTRRVIRSRLNTQEERPELRKFEHNPVATILKNRGAYIAAALTICRAYIAAGQPNKPTPLASFEGWSDTVRSALMWLGLEDPVNSMDSVRADDPDRGALEALLNAWSTRFGTGADYHKTLSEVIAAVNEVNYANAVTHEVFYANQALRTAVLNALGGMRQLDSYTLSIWLRQRKDRIVNGMWFTNQTSSHHPTRWWVMRSQPPTNEFAPPRPTAPDEEEDDSL